MKKPVIDAMEALTDIRAGLDDVDLMEKYNLSARGLQSLFKKLASMGFLDKKTMDVVLPPRESVPPDQIKQVSAKQFLIDFRGGMSDNELMRKHHLSSRELENLFGKLLDAGLITEKELEEQEQEHEMDTTVDVREEQLPQGFPIPTAKAKSESPKTPATTMPPARRPDVLPKTTRSKSVELELIEQADAASKKEVDPKPAETSVPEQAKTPWQCPVCHKPQAEKVDQCPECGFVTATSLEMVETEQQTTQVVESHSQDPGATQELEIVEEEETPQLEFERPDKETEPPTEELTPIREHEEPPTEELTPIREHEEPTEKQVAPQVEQVKPSLKEAGQRIQAEETATPERNEKTRVEEAEPPHQDLQETLQKLEDSLKPSEPMPKPQVPKVAQQQPRRRVVMEKQREMRARLDTATSDLEEQTGHLKTELYGKLLGLANTLKWFGMLQLLIVLAACALGIVSAIISPTGFTFSSWITILSLTAIVSLGTFIFCRVLAAGISFMVDLWAEIRTGNVLLQKLITSLHWDKEG